MFKLVHLKGFLTYNYFMSFIQAANPVFKDAKLGKHTSYEVSGRDEKGDFLCMRRYKEFDALRKALQRRWPGCLVPAIPSKQAIVEFI